MMEDTQPNEVRLSRKGSTNIPRVRTARPARAPYPKTPRCQPPPTHVPLPRADRAAGRELVEIHLHLPRECQKGAPGSHNARKRWIEDQKFHLWTDRHLSVLSFRYLDHDDRVLFTCRTPQAVQSTRHDTKDNLGLGPHPDNAHLETGRTVVPQQAKMSYGDLTQNDGGPSGLEDCAQRPDGQSRIPSSGCSVGTMLVEPSTTEIKSRPVRALHTNPVLRQQAMVHTTPPTEVAIDLTLDYPDPVAGAHHARWSTFRSGYIDILLPAFSNGSMAPSPEANTDPRSSIRQTPTHVVEQREDMPVIQSSVADPHAAHTDICANGTIPIRLVEDHRLHGPHSDRLRQHDALEAACSKHPRNHSTIIEGEREMLSSPPDYSTSVPDFASASGNILLSLGPHDRPRRILHDHGFTYVITAHGIVDQVGAATTLKLNRRIRSPSLPFEEFIDDACILSHQGGSVVVLGHVREQDQIAFLGLERGQILRHITLQRHWNPTKRPGVSAVTSLMFPLKFASGGYDHRVHLWDIAQDLSGASTVELAIKHTSLVHSLLPIVDTSHKLVSVGADRDVPIYDLSAECVVQTLKTSCIPYHAHRTDTRSCTLLEVSHLETQFELRDHRLPNQAAQRFGFFAGERRGRFEKADSWTRFVVCGDRSGSVHLWDLRNVSREASRQQCFNDPVIQVVNTGPRLLACSKKNELACISF